MTIIRIPTKTLESHRQIPDVLRQEFPDLHRMPPERGYEVFKTNISKDKFVIPLFEYRKDKLYLKALI